MKKVCARSGAVLLPNRFSVDEFPSLMMKQTFCYMCSALDDVLLITIRVYELRSSLNLTFSFFFHILMQMSFFFIWNWFENELYMHSFESLHIVIELLENQKLKSNNWKISLEDICNYNKSLVRAFYPNLIRPKIMLSFKTKNIMNVFLNSELIYANIAVLWRIFWLM